MPANDQVAVNRFQGNSPGEVFRQAADWLDQLPPHSVIESINHVQLPRAPAGSELLSIFTSSAQGHSDENPATTEPTWIHVTRAVFEELGISYAPTGRQVGPRHIQAGQWILLTHAVQMVKAIALGAHQAIDPPKSPDIVPDTVDLDRLHEAAVSWIGEIVEHFGGAQAFADRTLVLRAISPRVALASLGSAFYSQDAAAIAAARATLAEVNWRVSYAWQGIGGHITEGDSGLSMVAGSGKGSIGRALRAMKPDTEIGRAVREQS